MKTLHRKVVTKQCPKEITLNIYVFFLRFPPLSRCFKSRVRMCWDCVGMNLMRRQTPPKTLRDRWFPKHRRGRVRPATALLQYLGRNSMTAPPSRLAWAHGAADSHPRLYGWIFLLAFVRSFLASHTATAMNGCGGRYASIPATRPGINFSSHLYSADYFFRPKTEGMRTDILQVFFGPEQFAFSLSSLCARHSIPRHTPL